MVSHVDSNFFSEQGTSYVKKLESTYSQNYLAIAKKVITYLESNSIKDVTNLVLKNASTYGRSGDTK